MEIWKPIAGFDGAYEISSLGRGKRLSVPDANGALRKEKILKPCHTGDGYYVFYLYKNGTRHIRRINRLVASTFIPNPENKQEVNHDNKIRSDNRVSNLAWATPSENVKHSYDTGRTPYMLGRKGVLSPMYGKTGELNSSSKKVMCGTLDMIFPSACEASRLLGVNFSSICAVCRGDIRHVFGLSFRYLKAC